MSVEDELGPEDRLAAMRLLTALTLYQLSGSMSHRERLTLSSGPGFAYPYADQCIDEALRLVAKPHEKESGETDWTLLDSARDWLESDTTIPGNSDDKSVTQLLNIEWLLHHAAQDRNLKGECARLWNQMLREIA